MEAYSKIFRKPDLLPDREHFLLIGAPRSGTTLLAAMIGCHSEVGMINEDITGRGLRQVLGRRVTGNKLCVPNQIQLQRRGHPTLRLLKKFGIVAEAPRSKYSIKDYLELPNLKVIAIVRDGNDSISSMVSRGRSALKKAIRRWSQAIETIYELKETHGERVLVVAFEDLVLDPLVTMRTVCRFLGLAFQPLMLDGHKYNAYYPQPKLNEEKAYRHKRENIDLGLAERLPQIWQRYQELLRYAQETKDQP